MGVQEQRRPDVASTPRKIKHWSISLPICWNLKRKLIQKKISNLEPYIPAGFEHQYESTQSDHRSVLGNFIKY